MIPVHFRDPDTGKPAAVHVEGFDDCEAARAFVAAEVPGIRPPILAVIVGGKQPEAAPGPDAA